MTAPDPATPGAPPPGAPPYPDDPQRRAAELSTLYEAARALIGARDREQVAARVVLTGMGSLGVRSGAMFVADEGGRYRLLFSAGLDAPPDHARAPRAAGHHADRSRGAPLPAARRAPGRRARRANRAASASPSHDPLPLG